MAKDTGSQSPLKPQRLESEDTAIEASASGLFIVREYIQSLTNNASADAMQRQLRSLLGDEHSALIERLKPESWVPMESVVAILLAIEAKLGANAVRSIGRLAVRKNLAEMLRTRLSPSREALYSLDAILRLKTRGSDVGTLKVLTFDDDTAVLESTTTYPCLLEEGVLVETCATMGSRVMLSRPQCRNRGARSCVFKLTRTSSDRQWT